MLDRQPIYPGRITLLPVDDTINTYDVERADEPTQEGDPLNKNTFLKDETANLFGLEKTAVPDDVFREIHNRTVYKEIGRVVAGEWTKSLIISLDNVAKYSDFLVLYSSGTNLGTLPPEDDKPIEDPNIRVSFGGFPSVNNRFDTDIGSEEKSYVFIKANKDSIGDKVIVSFDPSIDNGVAHLGNNTESLVVYASQTANPDFYFLSDAEIIVYAR